MYRLLTLLVALMTTLVASAQQVVDVPALRFDTTEWNFGRIDEGDGKVSHTFRYTNTSDHSVAIEAVYSSCGCTTGDYSRRPLAAGKSGEFVVSFDPEGRPGRVDKTMTIVCDGGKGRIELRIKGHVKGRERSKADLYPFVLAEGVRADGLYKALGNVAQQTTKSTTLALYNDSSHSVEIAVERAAESGALELAVPRHVAAGQSALVSLTYALVDEEPRYGLLRDSLYIVVDGVRAAEPIVTTAIGVDKFDDRKQRPKAKIATTYYDFGPARVGESLTTHITIANEGSEMLVVRSVTPRAYTSVGLTEGDEIAPGESREVPVTLSVAEDSYGLLFGGAMIVVNDPSRPVRELRVAAQVER